MYLSVKSPLNAAFERLQWYIGRVIIVDISYIAYTSPP